MANPLKILNHLSASEAAEFSKVVTFKSNVVMSGTKVTGLAAASANGDAVRYEQLSSVDTRISAENSSRIAGDNSLSDRLGTEESTRAAADTSLTSRVSAEESARSAAVSAEESSRISGDSSLTTRVSAEESARASADTSLSSKIDVETSNRSSADSSLTTRVSAEESERARVVSVEASIRASADESLTTRLAAEESNSLSVDLSHGARMSAEESMRASADGSLATAFASADTSLTNRLSSEESNRTLADSSLTTRISAEESARASAITAANTSIDSRVSAEESARASADTSLTSRVSAEESARASADGSLAVAFASADTSLTSRIQSEESARASADTSIVTSLSSETSARASADTSLSTALTAEESARAAEDLLFLKLDGTRAMTGDLNMGSKNITFAKSGSFSGDVTVDGNLNVKGALTYLESTNTQVKDNQIELNYAATPVSNADAGIVIKGSAANKDVKLLVDADGGNLVVNTMVSASALKASGNGELGGTLVVKGQAAVSSSLMISGASWGPGNTAVGWSDGMYNVDSALRVVGNMNDTIGDGYMNLRHVNEVNLVGGTLTYALPETSVFADTQLGKIMVDVLVASGGGWSNDLIAVKIEDKGNGYLQLVIDAPAHQDGAVRIIAVNEGMDLQTAGQ